MKFALQLAADMLTKGMDLTLPYNQIGSDGMLEAPSKEQTDLKTPIIPEESAIEVLSEIVEKQEEASSVLPVAEVAMASIPETLPLSPVVMEENRVKSKTSKDKKTVKV